MRTRAWLRRASATFSESTRASNRFVFRSVKVAKKSFPRERDAHMSANAVADKTAAATAAAARDDEDGGGEYVADERHASV